MSAAISLSHDWFPRPLPDNVVLGARSWCYSSYAFLHYRSRRKCGVRVGSDSGIYHGSFFDLGPDGEVVIGNYCALVGVIISTNGSVLIRDSAFLAHEVVVADSFAATTFDLVVAGTSGAQEPERLLSPSLSSILNGGEGGPAVAGPGEEALRTSGSRSVATARAGEIIIGENCWVGARAVILSGARIGEGAIIGAAAVVDFEVPPGAIVAGNPARIVGWVHEHER